MIDSLAVKKILDNYRPNNSTEFYVSVVLLTLLLAWVAYLYFNSGKRGGDSAKQRNGTVDENGSGLLTEDRDRLIRIEESISGFKEEYKAEIKELREAFRSLVHDRGDTMAQIGEIKGELKSLVREIGRN